MYVLSAILPLLPLPRGREQVTHSCYVGEGGEQETRRQGHPHPFLRGRWEEGEAQPQMSKLAFKTYPVHLTLESVSSRSDLFSLEQALRCLWGVTRPPWLPPAPPGHAGPASSATPCLAWFQSFPFPVTLLTLSPLVVCAPCVPVNAKN